MKRENDVFDQLVLCPALLADWPDCANLEHNAFDSFVSPRLSKKSIGVAFAAPKFLQLGELL